MIWSLLLMMMLMSIVPLLLRTLAFGVALSQYQSRSLVADMDMSNGRVSTVLMAMEW